MSILSKAFRSHPSSATFVRVNFERQTAEGTFENCVIGVSVQLQDDPIDASQVADDAQQRLLQATSRGDRHLLRS